MTTSRDQILNRLRAAQPELGAIETVSDHLPVVPLADPSQQGLLDRFVEQAELLASEVHLTTSSAEAIQLILGLVGEEERVLSWAFEHMPLPGLEDAFARHGIQVGAGRDRTVRVGLTGENKLGGTLAIQNVQNPLCIVDEQIRPFICGKASCKTYGY